MRLSRAAICALGVLGFMPIGDARAQAGKIAPVSASGSTNLQPASNAADSNRGTRWESD
ncbi:hypothetical protein [Aquimonas sp.]|jgi:hypothetical protein|uniref:hypothetical protein n=1 Tax=Aquimonas sp. TaxID=1872588 RepID=UPI0037C15E81